MAKVTQQDVVNFLKEKVAQLTKELETTQNALIALDGPTVAEYPVKRGRKPKVEDSAAPSKRKTIVKTGGAKRGRKPKSRTAPVEQPQAELVEHEQIVAY